MYCGRLHEKHILASDYYEYSSKPYENPPRPFRSGAITFNNSDITMEYRYNGIIALHASKETDPGNSLCKYRKREKIGESIQRCKGDTLFNGRQFAKMAAMGCHEGMQKEVKHVKEEVACVVAGEGA